jgi:hypothetical protein
MVRTTLLVLMLLVSTAAAANDHWIDESNRYAQILLEINARYDPEGLAAIGVEGHDTDIVDLKPGFSERQEADLAKAVTELTARRDQTTHPLVRQDLEILIRAAQDQRRSLELERRLALPFSDLAQAVFRGFQDLLDERVDKARHPAALTRLRRYAGREPGYEPITRLARARFEEAARDPSRIGPWIVEVEQYLANQPRYLDGIEALLRSSGLKGWRNDLRALRQQFGEYEAWVRSTVIPRARKTHQLPAELYADNLRRFGVQMDPHELMNRALASFQQTRTELEVVAREVARQRRWNAPDYREVIRQLKKEQIPPDRLLKLYATRLQTIEDMIRRANIVSLPTRKTVIRLATEAESAARPAPYIDPPRFVGNTGEPLEFVIPTRNPNAQPGSIMDDFSYDAIAWTLTAHEARPGHELQFAGILERGVSTARVVYAFNSANVEGWALYAEGVMKRLLPPEGQVGALQMRMMREARAFLDPMLNLGLIDPDSAKRVLMEEVLLSEPMAKQEVDRYTFSLPGQATAYFYGFSMFNALRTRVELALADRFDEQRFHDFIISQGLLPFDLLEETVMRDFVGKAQR